MTIKTFLRILFTPECWVRNNLTSPKVTKFINDSLDAGHLPVSSGLYTHELNGKTIWTANYPYAYGRICIDGSVLKTTKLPDRATVFRLHDVIEQESENF